MISGKFSCSVHSVTVYFALLPTTTEATHRMNQLNSSVNSFTRSFNVGENNIMYSVMRSLSLRASLFLPLSFFLSMFYIESVSYILIHVHNACDGFMSHMTIESLFLTLRAISNHFNLFLETS